MERSEILLRACLEIINKCEDSSYVLDFAQQTAFYDDAECDGLCLKEDIESFLEFGV